eukprot:482176_1
MSSIQTQTSPSTLVVKPDVAAPPQPPIAPFSCEERQGDRRVVLSAQDQRGGRGVQTDGISAQTKRNRENIAQLLMGACFSSDFKNETRGTGVMTRVYHSHQPFK